MGVEALRKNDTGSYNVALGAQALFFIKGGSNNVAIGPAALNQIEGDNNIAIGVAAGSSISTGNNNILVGNTGVGDESNTIRIGRVTDALPFRAHTGTFIAGIRDAVIVDNPRSVSIDASGQLGIAGSSRRYKDEIRDMGEASNDLLKLRPVTFRYKQAAVAGERPREYGLIAEEVAEVYPDLVVHSAKGEIESVQYHKLVPMLLNELQKQHQQLGKQEEEINQLKARLAALERLVPAKESLAQW
jgi:hypothetical protein